MGGRRKIAVLVTAGTAVATAGTAAAMAVADSPQPVSTATTGAQAAPAAEAVPAAKAAPRFRLPFPCGQVWTGNSSNSSAHTGHEIDFNRGATAEADNGDTVVAAAAGTVIRSTRHTTQSGFGHHVVIQHSGGYTTWYAHLKYRSVKVGQRVAAGTRIGAVGRSTRPGNSRMSSHLHYEVRYNGGYPPVAAFFEGRRFGYPQQTLKACSADAPAPPAPADPVARICGPGYRKIDEAVLRAGGRTYGRVYLGYRNGSNCVATVKPKGSRTPMTAFLQVKGAATRTDRGSYRWYAGPVRAEAAGRCVRWGGGVSGTSYASAFEHCR
ncbi:M23 family metallopeptidase [Actinomadura kijaniata]|uniref:M23 family metallopeptidase n=1 Tax=Actinomadura kijaniata TaxID=46161 RepID=UPI003F1A8599